jgi:hypothetical protein
MGINIANRPTPGWTGSGVFGSVVAPLEVGEGGRDSIVDTSAVYRVVVSPAQWPYGNPTGNI